LITSSSHYQHTLPSCDDLSPYSTLFRSYRGIRNTHESAFTYDLILDFTGDAANNFILFQSDLFFALLIQFFFQELVGITVGEGTQTSFCVIKSEQSFFIGNFLFQKFLFSAKFIEAVIFIRHISRLEIVLFYWLLKF